MAVYGKTTLGVSRQNLGEAAVRRNPVVFPENGTLDSISAWVDNFDASTWRVLFLVYDSAGNLVAVSEPSTTSSSPAVNLTLPVLGSIALVAGETYWIGAWGENSGTRIYWDDGVAGDGAFADGAAVWPTAPDPFVLDFEIARDYSIAINYTPSAAVTTASRNVTNVAAGAVQTFQVMAAGVNTTAGEGLGGSDLVVIEDNHQVTVPLVVDGVTITIGADTLDYQLDQTEMAAAGNSITFDAFYYSPSTEKSSKIAVTVTAPGGGGSGSRTMTAWIEANGAGGQVNDAWITYMKAAGASGTTFNDLMFSWLGGLGYTGNLSDRVAAWSKVSLN